MKNERTGDLMRMTEDEIQRKVLTMQFDGTRRKRGRLKLRWFDDLSNDTKLFGLRD